MRAVLFLATCLTVLSVPVAGAQTLTRPTFTLGVVPIGTLHGGDYSSSETGGIHLSYMWPLTQAPTATLVMDLSALLVPIGGGDVCTFRSWDDQECLPDPPSLVMFTMGWRRQLGGPNETFYLSGGLLAGHEGVKGAIMTRFEIPIVFVQYLVAPTRSRQFGLLMIGLDYSF